VARIDQHWRDGGVNWPGSGFDPETAIFYEGCKASAPGLRRRRVQFIRVENQKTAPAAALGS
jgi:hypothetical protein